MSVYMRVGCGPRLYNALQTYFFKSSKVQDKWDICRLFVSKMGRTFIFDVSGSKTLDSIENKWGKNWKEDLEDLFYT